MKKLLLATILLGCTTLTALPCLAGERRDDDHVVLDLSTEGWVNTKTANVTVSRAGGVRVKAATCVVLEAPSIMLRASDTNYILVTQGQVVIEGAETFINPREAAPEL